MIDKLELELYIKYFKECIELIEPYGNYAEVIISRQICEGVIGLLEKQIPKKAEIYANDNCCGEVWYRCPTCKCDFCAEEVELETSYCDCGQAIDWTEEEQKDENIDFDFWTKEECIAIGETLARGIKDGLNKVAQSVKNTDKYRWHDLRENPNDLPISFPVFTLKEFNHNNVEVTHGIVLMNDYTYDMNDLNMEAYWRGDIGGALTTCEIEGEKIIANKIDAWKYIKPFEGE